MDRKELEKEYKRNARTANLRLQRLEEYAKEDGFQVATKWAYAKAMRDIHKTSGAEANRFNVAPPADDKDLFLMNQKIKEFLDSKTSTKVGIKRVYVQKAETINEKYGTNFSWDELGKFFEKETISKLDSSFSSQTVLRTLGTLQYGVDDLVERIRDAAETIELLDEADSVFAIMANLANAGISIDPDKAKQLSNVLTQNLGDYDPADLVAAANALHVKLPGETSQDKRNVKKMLESGKIDWEDILT